MQSRTTPTEYRTQLRKEILDVARQSFIKLGVKAVKMDGIAQQLGISKRTLYEIFPNKEQLLMAVVEAEFEEGQRVVSEYAAAHSDVMDILIFILRRGLRIMGETSTAFYEELSKYTEVTEYIERIRRIDNDKAQGFLKRGIEEGYFRNDLNYEIVGFIIEAEREAVFRKRLYDRYSHEEIFFNSTFLTLRGVCTPKGAERLDKSFLMK